jgi:hypothetical protein
VNALPLGGTASIKARKYLRSILFVDLSAHGFNSHVFGHVPKRSLEPALYVTAQPAVLFACDSATVFNMFNPSID